MMCSIFRKGHKMNSIQFVRETKEKDLYAKAFRQAESVPLFRQSIACKPREQIFELCTNEGRVIAVKVDKETRESCQQAASRLYKKAKQGNEQNIILDCRQ